MQIKVAMKSESASVAEDKQLALLIKQRDALTEAYNRDVKALNDQITKINEKKKKTEIAGKKEKIKGYTYVIVLPDKREIEKKTLNGVANYNVPAKMAHQAASAYAVSPDGKRTKVMVWGSVDPVTGRKFRGRSWHYSSAAARKKFHF